MEALFSSTTTNMEDVLDAFETLDLKKEVKFDNLSLSEILDLEWTSHLSKLDLTRGDVQRAVQYCNQCGIER